MLLKHRPARPKCATVWQVLPREKGLAEAMAHTAPTYTYTGSLSVQPLPIITCDTFMRPKSIDHIILLIGTCDRMNEVALRWLTATCCRLSLVHAVGGMTQCAFGEYNQCIISFSHTSGVAANDSVLGTHATTTMIVHRAPFVWYYEGIPGVPCSRYPVPRFV